MLSKNLGFNDVPRDFPQDWGQVTYNLPGAGLFHIIVKTSTPGDVVSANIGYQQPSSVDKFGNTYYNPINKFIGTADQYSDIDTTTSIPQGSTQPVITLTVKSQTGIISFYVYRA